MFVDEIMIHVAAGKGGDGRASFLRSRHQPKGGPDGGDGGRGGNVVVRAEHNSSTLAKYRTVNQWKADDGGAGGGNMRHGKNGADLILIVPPGTLVRIDDRVVADLATDGQEEIIARGGRGGLGNTHFATATHQAPRFAELGEPGDAYEVTFELKLLADVGLVGLPNAGKSTLLSVVSSAKPKIADYPFTTLTPQLGVARYHEHEFVVADIPGLIEGASAGKGLGDTFLKHIERTRVLLIMIDAASGDPAGTYGVLMNELRTYSETLADRPQVVALTKTTLIDEELVGAQTKKLARAAGVKHTEILHLSSQEHEGLDALMARLAQAVANAPMLEAEADLEETEITMDDVADWYLDREGEDRVIIKGRVAERWAARTNFDNQAAVDRLKRILTRAGVYKKLDQHGIDSGQTHLIIGGKELEW